MRGFFVATVSVLMLSACGSDRDKAFFANHPSLAGGEPALFSLGDYAGAGAAARTAYADAADPEDPNRECKAMDIDKNFTAVMECMKRNAPAILADQKRLLEERYDLSDRPSATLRMTRGKPIQLGVRARLAAGATWESLGTMSPEQIREQGLFPWAFRPLPHVNHPEGGMVFPKFHIEEILRQTRRDLNRFDVEFDLPDHVLPEFPPPIFLTTRQDLGDVSGGKLITHDNLWETFKDILNPKDLDGLQRLLMEMPQQQFNITADRRSVRPSLGVTCFECHANGHTNASFHLVGDIRPQTFRNRIDTPSLRGVRIQRLFGSQRALQTVEDFTEFEQRAAYFDGDITQAVKKGVRVLERSTEVHHMSEMQRLFDFPPAPKLNSSGRLIHSAATPAEIRGETVFFGKGQCATCHAPPHYSDNQMHDLKIERFFKPAKIRGMTEKPDGPIKTFPLRGIKDSPPYFHDGRLLTLDDTVEFFNLVLETKLTAREKADLVAFLQVL